MKTEEETFYLSTISDSMCTRTPLDHIYMPRKLSRSTEEAKSSAAEYTLSLSTGLLQ